MKTIRIIAINETSFRDQAIADCKRKNLRAVFACGIASELKAINAKALVMGQNAKGYTAIRYLWESLGD